MRLVRPAWLILLVIPGFVKAQAPDDLAIEKRPAARQNTDGGFSPAPGEPSNLGTTNTAIKILGFVGGSIPDPLACVDFIKSCQDAESGGFAPTPGGTPNVGTTASGLMALGELRAITPEISRAAIRYLDENAKTFEEVRIAAAALEAIKAKAPRGEVWQAIITEGKQSDGTWGEGAKRAFDTGGRAAALLRLGFDVDQRENVIKALLEAQNSDGGWSQEGTTSDLSSTYRIMRALYMLNEPPDLDRLEGFLASCRASDGLFGSAPGKASDLGGTYSALIVRKWSRLMSGLPARVEVAASRPLFNGQDLEGWEGDLALWSVQDGVLVGESRGLDHNTFLAAPGTYADFDLQFSFRLRDGRGNSGVQFRSKPLPPHEMSGYQADIGEGFWGCLYDESRRNQVLAQASEKAKAAVRPNGWNQYRIRARGDHIELFLNGESSVDFREPDSSLESEGVIAMQIHGGPPMRIEFRDMRIQVLPRPTTVNLDKPGFHLRAHEFGGQTRRYTVFVPTKYDGKQPVPVVLFLHGAGERGEDGVVCAQTGLGASIAQNPEAYPFIAVFPQARRTWEAGSDDAHAALAALAEVQSHYKTDPTRVYLTGLSMGGHGTWTIAAAHPKRFAAIAPVCGFARPEVLESLSDVPTWTVVGDADMEFILNSTRELARGLRGRNNCFRYTEYRDVGHNSWDRAYSTPALISWLLSHHLPATTP